MRKFFSKKESNNSSNNNNNNNNSQETELQPMVPYELKNNNETSINSVPYDVLVSHILSLLDTHSLVNAMEVNKFFSGAAKDPRLWKKHVHKLLTENPKLKQNENFYGFLSRFKPMLIKLKKLFNEEPSQIHYKVAWEILPKDISPLSLLEKMARNDLEKPFSAILAKYSETFDPVSFFCTSGYWAVTNNNPIILEQVLLYGDTVLNKTHNYYINAITHFYHLEGETRHLPLLYRAANCGSLDCLSLLLSKLSELNPSLPVGNLTRVIDTPDPYMKRTALHDASYGGQLNCVKFLVSKGASLSIKDINNQTPYEIANEIAKVNDHKKENDHKDVATYLANEMKERNISLPEEVAEDNKCIIQ